jgi:flagellar protein FlbD
VILVTRLNGSQFYINAELIEVVESTPDTVISLVNGVKMIVHEPADVIVERVIRYRQQIYSQTIFNNNNKNQAGA